MAVSLLKRRLLSIGISSVLCSSVYAVPVSSELPNDPRFLTQWGFEQPNDMDVDVMTAWEMVKDKAQQQVIVAVIDLGVDTAHSDLKNRLVPGYDFVSNDSNPIDQIFPHGTPIAGIIAAEKNNGYSVSGLAGDMPIKIMSLRVYSTEEMFGLNPLTDEEVATRLIAAFNYAIDNGAKVINFSQAISQEKIEADPVIYSQVSQIIQKALDKGVIVVSGPGNSSSLNPNLFPVVWDSPNIISVASINSRGALATDWDNTGAEPQDHTSYGANTHLAAPGTRVESTWPFYDLIDPALTGQDAGTSFATPYVAATIAMAMSVKPQLMQADTPEQAHENVNAIRQALFNGVQQTPELLSRVDADGDGIAETALVQSGGFLKIPLVLEQLGITLSERNGDSVLTYPKAIVAASEQGEPVDPYGGKITLPYANKTVQVDAGSSYDNDGSIVSYQWDFGDGTIASGITASHTYAHTGSYNITLTVMDNDFDESGQGKSDVSAPQLVEVLPPDYDFVTIRYKEEGNAFDQEGRLINGNIDIIENTSGKRKLSGSGQFIDENGEIVDVAVSTSYPFWGVVSGNVSFANPNVSRAYSFVLIDPVDYNAVTNTYSLSLPIMEFHFTEAHATP